MLVKPQLPRCEPTRRINPTSWYMDHGGLQHLNNYHRASCCIRCGPIPCIEPRKWRFSARTDTTSPSNFISALPAEVRLFRPDENDGSRPLPAPTSPGVSKYKHYLVNWKYVKAKLHVPIYR